MAFCTTVDSVMNMSLQKASISRLQEILLFQLFFSKISIKSQNTVIFLEITPCKMFINRKHQYADVFSIYFSKISVF